MDPNSAMLGIALIERILLEDIEGIRALCSVLNEGDKGDLVQFLATVSAELLLSQDGLTPAIERVDSWRMAALAGAANA